MLLSQPRWMTMQQQQQRASMLRACCCDAVDLTCPSAGLFTGCIGFSVKASARFGLCITDEVGVYTNLNKSDPGYLLERVAPGEYLYEEPEVVKIEMDYTDDASTNDDIEIRGYLWNTGTASWDLIRTVTNATTLVPPGGGLGGFRGQGHKLYAPPSANASTRWRLWSIDQWFPATITAQLKSLSVCDASTYGCFGVVGQYGRVSSMNLTAGTLSRYSASVDTCEFRGTAGTITVELYNDAGDCYFQTNMDSEVTYDIEVIVPLVNDRTTGQIDAGVTGFSRQIFTAAGTAIGGGTFTFIASETINVANGLTCADFTPPVTEGGSIDITFPTFGT